MDTFDTTGNFIVALKQLEEYSKQHFDREEMYQELIGYPGLEQHRISHMELIIQLKELIDKVSMQDSLEEAGMNKAKFIEFVRHWLIDHVINEDLLFKPFAKRT